MRKAEVYRNGELAGFLIEDDNRHYTFSYDDDYFLSNKKSSISLKLPKSQKEYRSEILFPFFFNMLSEGVNRKLQSRTLHIDEKDHFAFLLATAIDDTIGAITIKPITE
ncbi:MAG: HipA N-terminal domain-containing protein [Bacteroidales bacterium]|nr:HipA N-terminal domain-containing protein [Bacteroidales bacterium]